MPGSAAPVVERAETELLDDRLDEALADADAALSIDSTVAGPYETRGRIHERRGERDLAIADFRRALQINAGSSVAKLGLLRLGAEAR